MGPVVRRSRGSFKDHPLAARRCGGRREASSDENGAKLCPQFIFDASTRAQLKRIACHKGCSVTSLIKERGGER